MSMLLIKKKRLRYGYMLTNKAHLFILYFQIGHFRLPIVLPVRCLLEVVNGLCDITSLFTFFDRKLTLYISIAENTMYSVRDIGKYDFVDIAVRDHGKKIRILISAR